MSELRLRKNLKIDKILETFFLLMEKLNFLDCLFEHISCLLKLISVPELWFTSQLWYIENYLWYVIMYILFPNNVYPLVFRCKKCAKLPVEVVKRTSDNCAVSFLCGLPCWFDPPSLLVIWQKLYSINLTNCFDSLWSYLDLKICCQIFIETYQKRS